VAAFSKAALRRQIEAERRATVKAALADLRARIKQLKSQRREETAYIKLQCRRAREKLRNRCAFRRVEARSREMRELYSTRAELARMAEAERIERRAIAGSRGSRGPYAYPFTRQTRAAEHREESDSEVLANIPDDLADVFKRLRKQFKGSEHRSRTEAFLQWVEENPGEVWALREQQTERELAQLLRDEQRMMGRAA
jgi:hypothetical protein